jgi:hypothetical protein
MRGISTLIDFDKEDEALLRVCQKSMNGYIARAFIEIMKEKVKENAQTDV